MKDFKTLKLGITLAGVLALTVTSAQADTFGTLGNEFTIDFVTVGNAGNADDSGTTGSYSSPYGGVDYTFRMGTFEVSRDMVTKASTSGTLGITLADMTSYGGNVGTHPATGVSWNEAARFVNWLNVSTGHQAAYKFSLQPGDGGYNANANFLLWESGDAGYNAANPYRNANAYYFLPSEDEWYKAAYYSGSGTTYYDYALGSNSIPTAVVSGATGAVYGPPFSTGPANIDNAGGRSPYGTAGQNGNVWEWNESAYDGVNNTTSENRAFRGGYWISTEFSLRSSLRFNLVPTNKFNDMGFRVASVPEPSTTMLMIGTGLAWLLGRRRPVPSPAVPGIPARSS